MKISIKSPTRVDLAGGTLDLWPLYNFVGGATTVNVAIDIHTFAEIIPSQDSKIILESEDLDSKKSFVDLSSCLNDPDPTLNLLKVQLNYWKPTQGFHLRTSSQSPVGGGLGGSSSLTISLYKAFSQFCNNTREDTHQIVHTAHNMESQVLNTPTGTQDYYPAVSGGLNILKYNMNGIEQKILNPCGTDLDTHFLLIYTGKAHHSGLNNFQVLKSSIEKDPAVMNSLFELKSIANEMSEVCEFKKWDQIPELFEKEYQARIKLAPAFSSPEIEQLHKLAKKSGAEAVKICGAGGGGCVLIWVDPTKKERVAQECQKAGFKALDAKPVAPQN